MKLILLQEEELISQPTFLVELKKVTPLDITESSLLRREYNPFIIETPPVSITDEAISFDDSFRQLFNLFSNQYNTLLISNH